MKKMIFGIMLSCIAAAFALCSFVIAALRPGVYNNTGGLLGSFLCADLLIPFIIAMIVMLTGIVICAVEAYSKKQ